MESNIVYNRVVAELTMKDDGGMFAMTFINLTGVNPMAIGLLDCQFPNPLTFP